MPLNFEVFCYPAVVLNYKFGGCFFFNGKDPTTYMISETSVFMSQSKSTS